MKYFFKGILNMAVIVVSSPLWVIFAVVSCIQLVGDCPVEESAFVKFTNFADKLMKV